MPLTSPRAPTWAIPLLAAALAAEAGLNLPLATATKAQFERLVAAGHGGLDKSGVAELTFKGRG